MEILRHEFEEKLPLIKEAIQDADMISIDAEFTGLTPSDVHLRPDDDLPRRYGKVRRSVQQFAIIQYGICAFKRVQNEKYIAKPFNFYVFGDEESSRYGRPTFLSSTSSLSFLRRNKFDFNKLIDGGIPFYNFDDESMVGSLSRAPSLQLESMNPIEQKVFGKLKSTIDSWLQHDSTKPLALKTDPLQKRMLAQVIREKTYNGFLRYQTIDSASVEVRRVTDDDRYKRPPPTGPNFRTVIELISGAGCPVVAHNAFFDICFTFNQFWHNLPQSVEDFKRGVSSMWGNIMDTKYLAEYHPQLANCFDSSVLGLLYNTVDEELRKGGPAIVMADGFHRYHEDSGGSPSHEAGYDAFMTGVIYVGFIHYIRERQEEGEGEEEEKKSQADEEPKSPTLPSDPNSLALPDYKNRVFLMRCDIPYIDLQSDNEISRRPQNRAYLSNIPEGMTNNGIELLFPELLPLNIHWESPKSAWIIVKNKQKLSVAQYGQIDKNKLVSFLSGGEQFEEGKRLGITDKADKMKLMSFDEWNELQEKEKDAGTTEKSESTVPSGGSSYDDLDISIPASFANPKGVKRKHSTNTLHHRTKNRRR